MQIEASRANDRRKAEELANRDVDATSATTGDSSTRISIPARNRHVIRLSIWRFIDSRLVPWIQETSSGHFFFIFILLTFIALSGAIPIGVIEGWSFIQCIYFGCVSMTTVGKCIHVKSLIPNFLVLNKIWLTLPI